MLKIKNWDKFQHYKKGKEGVRMSWMKLYTSILDDPDWHQLTLEERGILVMLWLVGAEHGGSIPDLRKTAFQIRIDEEKLKCLIPRLSHWMSRERLERVYRDSRPEERRGDKKRGDKKRGDKKRTDIASVGTDAPRDLKVEEPETLKESKQPKPETDIQRVVNHYKAFTGLDVSDKDWDKAHFSRCAKSAKKLIDYLGGVVPAQKCISDVGGRLTGLGLTWTIETVCKHSDSWKMGKFDKGEVPTWQDKMLEEIQLKKLEAR